MANETDRLAAPLPNETRGAAARALAAERRVPLPAREPDAPAPPAPAAPRRPMTRRRRVTLVLGAILGAVIGYEVITSVVAYTDDAYVRSDLVAVAPQVTGRIIAVHIFDNQTVHTGDPLVTIDPEPFNLTVAQKRAEIAEATAQVAADQNAIAAAQAEGDAAQAQVELAQETQQRMAALIRSADVSRQTLDQANEDLRRSTALADATSAAVARTRSMAAMHQGALARAQAEMATAQWALSQTRLQAPTDGQINNLTVRVGDTATAYEPLIGIVDAHAWRVMANYKQSYLRGFTIGQTAWVWLDSEPWQFHRAHVTGIASGVSRDPAPVKLLPYVAPDTDWIRLQRRFPVTLVFDDLPPDFRLFMGADARTFIFP